MTDPNSWLDELYLESKSFDLYDWKHIFIVCHYVYVLCSLKHRGVFPDWKDVSQHKH